MLCIDDIHAFWRDLGSNPSGFNVLVELNIFNLLNCYFGYGILMTLEMTSVFIYILSKVHKTQYKKQFSPFTL